MIPKNCLRKGYNYFEIKGKVAYVYTRKGIFIIDKNQVNRILRVKWYIDILGYPASDWIDGSRKRLHQIILKPKKGLLCDHINRKKFDNRRINLRLVTHRDNIRNRNYKGYHFCKLYNFWAVQIRVNKKTIHIGTFKTEKEAKNARNQAEEKFYKGIRNGIIYNQNVLKQLKIG